MSTDQGRLFASVAFVLIAEAGPVGVFDRYKAGKPLRVKAKEQG